MKVVSQVFTWQLDQGIDNFHLIFPYYLFLYGQSTAIQHSFIFCFIAVADPGNDRTNRNGNWVKGREQTVISPFIPILLDG